MNPIRDDRVRLVELVGGDAPLPELRIDDVPVKYGQFVDGTYFLYENAYVWSTDLPELGVRLAADRALGLIASPHGRGEGGV